MRRGIACKLPRHSRAGHDPGPLGDWPFVLKLVWHSTIIGGGLAAVVGAFAFRWAWRRGVKIEAMRRAVVDQAAAKLAEDRKERVG